MEQARARPGVGAERADKNEADTRRRVAANMARSQHGAYTTAHTTHIPYTNSASTAVREAAEPTSEMVATSDKTPAYWNKMLGTEDDEYAKGNSADTYASTNR